MNHLFQLLRDRIGPANDRVFLETPSGTGLTYAAVLAASARAAAALTELGVEPGDRVAAQVEKTPEALMLYLGVIRAGAIFLPLNTAYTNAELGYFLATLSQNSSFAIRLDAKRWRRLRQRPGSHRSRRSAPMDKDHFPKNALASRGISAISHAAWTISPPFFTPRGPPAAPRAPC
jgi:acyl-CoA synthetase (AMP-forming)/AMP-acid ligase II